MRTSIVIPLYNEDENVHLLHQGIREALTSTGEEYEIVYVDDGSSDGTLPRLLEVVAGEHDVRVVQLSRNFGQTAALQAGIEHASGDVVVTMDGDLQNDPRDIPLLLAKIADGADLVCGWRRDRKDPRLSRNLPSRIANRLIAWVSGVPAHDTGCSLKAYRADLIRNIPLYSELHRFIPAMSTLLGARFAEVVVRHHPRRFGKSKYGLGRIGRVLIDLLMVKMLIGFSRRPAHWYGWWSVPFFGASLALGVHGLWRAAAGETALTVVGAAVLCGYLAVSLVVTGLSAELVIRSGRPRRLEPLARFVSIHSDDLAGVGGRT